MPTALFLYNYLQLPTGLLCRLRPRDEMPPQPAGFTYSIPIKMRQQENLTHVSDKIHQPIFTKSRQRTGKTRFTHIDFGPTLIKSTRKRDRFQRFLQTALLEPYTFTTTTHNNTQRRSPSQYGIIRQRKIDAVLGEFHCARCRRFWFCIPNRSHGQLWRRIWPDWSADR